MYYLFSGSIDSFVVEFDNMLLPIMQIRFETRNREWDNGERKRKGEDATK